MGHVSLVFVREAAVPYWEPPAREGGRGSCTRLATLSQPRGLGWDPGGIAMS